MPDEVLVEEHGVVIIKRTRPGKGPKWIRAVEAAGYRVAVTTESATVVERWFEELARLPATAFRNTAVVEKEGPIQ